MCMHCGSMFVYLKPCVKNTILFLSHITLKLVFTFKRTNHRWWIIYKANIAHNFGTVSYRKCTTKEVRSHDAVLLTNWLAIFKVGLLERVTNWGTRWNEKFYKPCGIYSDCFKLRILIPGKFIRFFHEERTKDFQIELSAKKDWNIGESIVEYFPCKCFCGVM